MSRGRILFISVVFAAVAIGYYRGRAEPLEAFHFSASTRPTFEPLERIVGSHRLDGILETKDGQPAEGIEVFLVRTEPLDSTAEPLHWDTTDAAGRFELRELAASEYTVILTRPGLRPQSRKVRIPIAAAADEFPWRLEESLPEMEALPDARRIDLTGRVIVPASQTRIDEIQVEGYEVLIRPIDGVHPLLGAAARRTLTDARGNFTFPGLIAADYTLELIPPWARSGSWPVLDRIEFSHGISTSDATGAPTLQVRASRIVARLQDQAGHPLEGALVLIWPVEAPDRIWPPTSTDAAGDFTLVDLPAGTYRLRIRAGSATHEETVEVGINEVKRLSLAPFDPRG